MGARSGRTDGKGIMSQLELVIVTPEREVLRRSVSGVTLPTREGEITVLPGHVPLVSTLQAGEVTIHQGDQAEPFAIGGGFIEVQPDKVVLLADTAEHLTEIDEQRVNEAIARAQRLKAELSQDHVEYAAMAGKLERDLARLRVVRKHRHHGHQGLPYEGTLKQ